MFAVLNLDTDVVAMYETRSKGSEVLLFIRNQGLLSRLRVPERGDAVEERLTRSFKQICRGGQRKPSHGSFPQKNENKNLENSEKSKSKIEKNG